MSNEQLCEHCDIRIIFTKRDVIPVPRYRDPENSITNGHTKMTGKGFKMTESNIGKLVHDRKLLFISSDIKSFFFAIRIEQGLTPNTVMGLIEIYKNLGVDLKKILY